GGAHRCDLSDGRGGVDVREQRPREGRQESAERQAIPGLGRLEERDGVVRGVAWHRDHAQRRRGERPQAHRAEAHRSRLREGRRSRLQGPSREALAGEVLEVSMRIALRGVSKRFGAHTAVDELSLDIEPGELVALVGGSGCGKTTTLRLIAGFERPDAGEVRFDDRVVNDVPPSRRGVGIVFQSYALFPTMTVADNIGFGLRVARWSTATIRQRVAELVTLTHLEGLETRYANQLSGGQQQRVALARALARRPGILLLDEPLSALDAKIRLRLRAEIRKLQQDLGVTTLYVTHDQEEALSLADRLAV